ncbi:MAG: O-antigen ligase family protein [Actinomycetota bacterium]|nr:O-antigen ligase family protein [Actinomycetota bacterium]
MSTAQPFHLRAARVPSPSARAATRLPSACGLVILALLGLLLVAAFAHGAVSIATQARIHVALAALAALVAVAWLWSGTMRIGVPRLALAGVCLLGAFAVWSGASLIWSVDPDATWLELNRTVGYLLMLILGIACGAWSPRAPARIGVGFLVVTLAVTIYALGQKLLPGLHVAGLFDLNQTASLPRLAEPLGYWNALALLLTLAAPLALGLATERSVTPRLRLTATLALQLMLLTLGLTLSRGGVLALVVVMIVVFWLAGSWLRCLMWLAVVVVATVPPLIFGLTSHALTAADVSLGRRETAGLLLLGILLASSLALVLGARWLHRTEPRVRPDPEALRRLTRLLQGAVALAVVTALLAVGLSSRGLGGTVSHAWRSFTTTHGAGVQDPHRLLSVDSENRWVWWKEAAGAFADRPLQGWGAGSFPVVHLLYRRDTLSVKQPHSLPLQWLAETGVVGAALGISALVLLLVAGARGIRSGPRGARRMLTAAMLAAAAGYAFHSLYDWDWDIPGVTLPAMLFLGLLAGAAGRGGVATSHTGLRPPPGGGPWVRTAALALTAAALCAFALSSVLPSLAASKAASAVLAAAESSPAALHRAFGWAALAGDLDPLSDSGLEVQATVALRSGRASRARVLLLQAVSRDPSDTQAWANLSYAEIVLRDIPQAARAANRALALDPLGGSPAQTARSIAAGTELRGTPPQSSATATPLPGR